MSHALPASISLAQVELIYFLIANVMRKNEFKIIGPKNFSLLVVFNCFGDDSVDLNGVIF